MSIGERIIKLREKKNWSQRELAKRSGLNPSVMNRIETGERPLRAEELKTIAQLLDVQADYLLGTVDKSQSSITVAGQEITLTPDELKVFEELKKHPIMFHDLATNPEQKVKELIKLYKMKKMFLEEEDEEYGEGFGELED